MARLVTAAAVRGNSFMSWYAIGFPSSILALGSSSVNLQPKQEEHQVVLRQRALHAACRVGRPYSGFLGRRSPYPFRMRCRFDHKDGHATASQLSAIDRNRLVMRLGSLSETKLNELMALLQAMFAV
jgi:mRNA-degrading endonuclease toxin of MazEF toxin-antitoxin module